MSSNSEVDNDNFVCIDSELQDLLKSNDFGPGGENYESLKSSAVKDILDLFDGKIIDESIKKVNP